MSDKHIAQVITPSRETKAGFKFGDRVRRDVDVFHPERGYRVGTVVSRYSQWGGLDGAGHRMLARWVDLLSAALGKDSR